MHHKPHIRQWHFINISLRWQHKRTTALRRLLHSLLYGDIPVDRISDLRVAEAFLEYFGVSVFEEDDDEEKQCLYRQRIWKFIDTVTNVVWVVWHFVLIDYFVIIDNIIIIII